MASRTTAAAPAGLTEALGAPPKRRGRPPKAQPKTGEQILADLRARENDLAAARAILDEEMARVTAAIPGVDAELGGVRAAIEALSGKTLAKSRSKSNGGVKAKGPAPYGYKADGSPRKRPAPSPEAMAASIATRRAKRVSS